MASADLLPPDKIDIRRQFLSEVEGYPTIRRIGSGDALGEIITKLVNITIIMAAIAVFLYLIWGGYNWLTAGDDKTKVEGARTRMTNAIIGLAIVVSAYAIFNIIVSFFGLNIELNG